MWFYYVETAAVHSSGKIAQCTFSCKDVAIVCGEKLQIWGIICCTHNVELKVFTAVCKPGELTIAHRSCWKLWIVHNTLLQNKYTQQTKNNIKCLQKTTLAGLKEAAEEFSVGTIGKAGSTKFWVKSQFCSWSIKVKDFLFTFHHWRHWTGTHLQPFVWQKN